MIKKVKGLFNRWGQTGRDDASGCKTLVEGERAYIRRLAQQRVFNEDSLGEASILSIPSDDFDVPTIYQNVRLILCSLNQQSSESLTVANCIFDEGGEIPAHKHHNKEHICVLAGELTETVSGKTFRADESITIHADQPHGFTSDYALLTITWRPELDIVEDGHQARNCC